MYLTVTEKKHTLWMIHKTLIKSYLVRSQGSDLQYSRIGSIHGLALNWWQVNILTNFGEVPWRHMGVLKGTMC